MLIALVGLGVVCALLLVAVLWLALERHRLRTALAESDRQVDTLQADLDAALRPPPATRTVDRAVRRVVRTATRVRDSGFSGLLASTIEELQAWAADERADIVTMAAADGTVTLLFSDIEDSTAINDRLGDSTWVKVLTAHDRLLRRRIEQYRGQVVKTAGDGFMVAFRDPEAGCRAATAIQRDLGRGGDSSLRRHGPVQVRIGVHTGQVVARDGDYFGRNVAMAARVADLASGGEVLASDAVRAALADDTALHLEAAGSFDLKGFSGEHPVWRVRYGADGSPTDG